MRTVVFTPPINLRFASPATHPVKNNINSIILKEDIELQEEAERRSNGIIAEHPNYITG